MYKMKLFLTLLFPLSLTACNPSEPSAAPAESSAPKAASATEAAAVPASAASEAAASAAAGLGGELAGQNQAKWQTYTCDEQQKIDVRYYKSSEGPAAQIRFKGTNINAPYSPELSDEDLSAFSNGEFTWTVSNLVETDFYREGDGFFIRHEQTGSTPEEGIVDNLLLQNCMPPAQ